MFGCRSLCWSCCSFWSFPAFRAGLASFADPCRRRCCQNALWLPSGFGQTVTRTKHRPDHHDQHATEQTERTGQGHEGGYQTAPADMRSSSSCRTRHIAKCCCRTRGGVLKNNRMGREHEERRHEHGKRASCIRYTKHTTTIKQACKSKKGTDV